ncbi:unnamed protein product [Medioppia subpectinata]|uniref:SREBP regulating gene protein n=1 Tax=Medioppia subpectinata TaxID=1979941 RepID=A0A7R9KD25_9ACAR|nr:unnamed protein product [Medioppia subpectinata]CAG2100867.1 unnamed protein product [Medioppia subpectinata]
MSGQRVDNQWDNEWVTTVLTTVLSTGYNVLKTVVRLLRKRIVLAIIFSLSFTYCLVSLLSQKSTTSAISAIDGTLEDYETDVDIDRLQHIIRQSQHLSHHLIPSDKNDSMDLNGNDNRVNSEEHVIKDMSRGVGSDMKCRNSIQGKVLIADDRGMLCHRKDVLLSGCCDENSVNTKLYSCETCQSGGCCAIYEYCISCCLDPNKKPFLTKIVSKKTSDTFNVLMASITDHFELCLTRCRTSSASVQHENSYRDPKAKHCFGEMNDKSISTNN